MKILLVEDNSLDVDLTRHELERAFSDLHLATTSRIEDAWATLESGAEFDIALVDLRLPDGDGLDLVSKIRFAGLPCAVVALTGQGDEAIAVSAIKLGADDYVAKRPGYHRKLPQIVTAAISRFHHEANRKKGVLRVLYTEHNPADIELTQRHLSRFAPHIRLDIVQNGAEVMARLQANADAAPPYEVLLLDFNLPGENAIDILKLLTEERRLDLPVILVTGQGDEEIAAQALRLGATDYIVKNAGYLYELPIALENAHHRARLAREQAALKVSEERFRRLAENASDMIFRYAYLPTPHFEYVSPSVVSMTGYSPEEQYADPELLYRMIHPDDRPLLGEASDRPDEHQQPVVLRWRRKDGRIIWTEQRTTPVYDGDGRLVAVEGIARDVTESRQVLDALQQHLGEMQALHRVSSALRTARTEAEAVSILLDQTLVAIQTEAGAVWLYDHEQGDLRVVEARGWCRQMAQTPVAPGEGITGGVFSSGNVHIEENVATSTRAHASLRPHTPQGWGGGWAPIGTSNEIVGVLFVAVPKPNTVTHDQIKLVVSLAEMAGSILQRLHLLRQAQAQVELTRQIVATVPEGLALLDAQNHILLANAQAEALLRNLGALLADDIAACIVGADSSMAPGAWHELQHQGRIFLWRAQPVEPGNPATSWVLVIDDVTKEREQQRYQEAQDRLATVGQLAAGIAHDFNNVLGVISVYADVMQAAPNLNPKQQRQLATVVEQAHHAASLVHQVLDFSRRAVMERTTVDLNMLVSEQIKLLRRTLPENIELRLRSDEQHFQVDADLTRLRQVVMNLAVNARDAMPDGGALTFALTRIHVGADDAKTPTPLPDMAPGGWVCLAVTDTGTGISPAILPHIFEPFFTTKAAGQGTGLGLAQVYGIVKQHGGTINVNSTVGQGTAFEIYLPLSGDRSRAPTGAPSVKNASGSECILLVEDNRDLCIALTQSMESLGYHVLQAFDGTAALRLASQPGVVLDLLLSDLVMPGWNGLDLYEAVQHLHPDARLLIMTGHPVRTAHAETLEKISGSWIQKPFTIGELAARVRSTLDKAKP